MLPDLLHPGYWYGAWVILHSLLLWLDSRRTLKEVASLLGVQASGYWRAPGRWSRSLLTRLWGWLGRQLGCLGAAEPPARQRLLRMLAHSGEAVGETDWELRAAPTLGTGTVHARIETRAYVWGLQRTAPEEMRRLLLAE